jgi:hypothetical protein
MLLAPLVVPPLTPWTRKVRVRNQRTGATVSIFEGGVKVGSGQVGGPDAFVELDAGHALTAGRLVTATQELGGDHSVQTPASSAVPVLNDPTSQLLAQIFSRAALLE